MQVLRAAVTEQTSALWDDVRESVARGQAFRRKEPAPPLLAPPHATYPTLTPPRPQFAVLTYFVENDETIYRFGHLTFQEHLCAMVINRMAADEMGRVRSIMVASGGIKKMLQAARHHNTSPLLRGACCGPSEHPTLPPPPCRRARGGSPLRNSVSME